MQQKQSGSSEYRKTHLKNLGRERGQTGPVSVTFYDIQPGNGSGLFFQPRTYMEPGP